MAVNANHFFIMIALLLAVILFIFEPTELKESALNSEEVAELEMSNFTLYELDESGLKNIMIGRKGFRYSDRIEVIDIDYTDSTQALQNNLQADTGIYDNENLITLEGNVRYYRDDGMKFVTNRAMINQSEETIETDGRFKMNKHTNNVVGSNLFYDTKNGLTRAEMVTGFYTLEQ